MSGSLIELVGIRVPLPVGFGKILVEVRQVPSQDRDVLSRGLFACRRTLWGLAIPLEQRQQQSQLALVATQRLDGGAQENPFQPRHAPPSSIFSDRHRLPGNL